MAAVFGSSARVPIATLLMVTEMTGGYSLLVPAALAVILGFFIQDFLSKRFKVKYVSLYEAQVRRQSYSQAHRTEHVKRALSILKDQKKIDKVALGKINLVPLLESKIPIKITENEQLFLGELSKKSHCINTSVEERCLNRENEGWKIISIIRNNDMLSPDPELRLEPEDEILILGNKKNIEIIRDNLSK